MLMFRKCCTKKLTELRTKYGDSDENDQKFIQLYLGEMEKQAQAAAARKAKRISCYFKDVISLRCKIKVLTSFINNWKPMKIFQLTLISISILFLTEAFTPQRKTELVSQTVKSDTTIIYLKDFQAEETRKKKDCNKFINEAIKTIEPGKPTRLVFTRGEYHFYPVESNKRTYFESNTTDVNPRNCAFLFENMNNLIIEGNGSNLIFHEQIQPFTFDKCKNVVLRNINIDWEQPLIAQAEVLAVSEKSIKVNINLKESPYRIEEGRATFGLLKQNSVHGKVLWNSIGKDILLLRKPAIGVASEKVGKIIWPKIFYRELSKLTYRFCENLLLEITLLCAMPKEFILEYYSRLEKYYHRKCEFIPCNWPGNSCTV